jgi:hypothetical protein
MNKSEKESIMDLTKTEQTRKLVAVTLYNNGRRIQAFVRGNVGEDGKTRITENAQRRLERALGAQRGDTISTG